MHQVMLIWFQIVAWVEERIWTSPQLWFVNLLINE